MGRAAVVEQNVEKYTCRACRWVVRRWLRKGLMVDALTDNHAEFAKNDDGLKGRRVNCPCCRRLWVAHPLVTG